MAEYEDETFETVGSGASLTEPRQCSSLRKNGYVLIKQRPCKIVEMSTSKTGKHGSAKVHMVAIDIFTGRKFEDISPSTANMDVPRVIRKEYELMDIQGGYMSLLCEDGSVKDDVPLPENDIGKEIQDKTDKKTDDIDVIVCIMSAMNEEHAVGVRTAVDKK